MRLVTRWDDHIVREDKNILIFLCAKRKMAQCVDKNNKKQIQNTQFDLRTHLSKYNVPGRVYGLLCDESITVSELATCTIKDLEDWCNEHSLKTMERRRFVNAIKSLPNAQANVQPVKEIVFLGNEEKEQLSQFDDMKNNVNKMMKSINAIENKSKVDGVIEEINKVCDEMVTFVEKLRKNLLQQVYINISVFCVRAIFCFVLFCELIATS